MVEPDSVRKPVIGIIAFILFIVVIIRTEKKLCIAKNRNIASVFGLIYTVYILKMGFDTYDFKLLIMVIYLIEAHQTYFQNRNVHLSMLNPN